MILKLIDDSWTRIADSSSAAESTGIVVHRAAADDDVGVDHVLLSLTALSMRLLSLPSLLLIHSFIGRWLLLLWPWPRSMIQANPSPLLACLSINRPHSLTPFSRLMSVFKCLSLEDVKHTKCCKQPTDKRRRRLMAINERTKKKKEQFCRLRLLTQSDQMTASK